MQKLYSAANLQEAHLLLHRLAHAGIEARVFNEHAQGGLGEIPVVYPEVWLLDDLDLIRAQKVLADYERADVSHATRTCPHCGEQGPENFELCWHCGGLLEMPASKPR
jgi:hypothetical protein